MKEVIYYKKENGEIPFINWLDELDKKLQSKIVSRTIYLQEGNYSNCSILKNSDGIKEARVRTASGLRIYFAEENNQIIILLVGGDKDTQKRDIQKAKEYWNDYKQRRL